MYWLKKLLNSLTNMQNTFAGEQLLYYNPVSRKTAGRLEELVVGTPTFNADAMYDYLLYGTVLPPNSMAQGIQTLFPGEEITLDIPQPVRRNVVYQKLGQLPTLSLTVAQFVDRLDEIFSRYFSAQLAGQSRVGVMLSGGIDSAIIASYLPKQSVAVTWGGWGSGTSDVRYAEQSFSAFKLAKHLQCLVDYPKDELLYHEALAQVRHPFPLSFGIPYARMAQTLQEHFAGQPFLVFAGQNADTITGAFRPTVYSYYFSKCNRYNPLRPIFAKLSVQQRKLHLLSTSNPVALIAFFHSCGIFPGPWLNVPKKYFVGKLSDLRSQIGHSPKRFSDYILMEELMTEARRNQFVQNALPPLYGAQVRLPYYHPEVVELFLQVPQRIRRQQNFGKVILSELARKRGVPGSVIAKGKKGMSYGYTEYIKQGLHVQTWDEMQRHELLNRYIDVAALRARHQNSFATFDLLRGLHAYLRLVWRTT